MNMDGNKSKMEAISSKCRFCTKNVFRKTKGSAIIDDEIKGQFEQLTGMTLFLSSHWEAICVVCLRSLQLACDFQELLVDNEKAYRATNRAVDEDVLSDEKSAETKPPTTSKTTKRKKDPQPMPRSMSENAVKKPKLIEKPKVAADNGEANKENKNIQEKKKQQQLPTKSPKLDENGNELKDDKQQQQPTSDKEKTSKEKALFECFHCNKVFSQKKYRTDHILAFHCKRRFPCVIDTCNQVMLRKYNVIKHIKMTHGNGLSETELEKLLDEAKDIEPVYDNPGMRTS